MGELFEEVIQRNAVHGPLLQEIKAAYDTYLRARGVAPPSACVAELRLPLGSAQPARGRGAGGGDSEGEGPAEVAVEAARRGCLEPVSPLALGFTSDEQFERLAVLERENQALRALAGRLRKDLRDEAAEGAGAQTRAAAITASASAQEAAGRVLGTAAAVASGAVANVPSLGLPAGPQQPRQQQGQPRDRPEVVARSAADAGDGFAEAEYEIGSGRVWLLETKLKSEPLSKSHVLALATRGLGRRPPTVPALDFSLRRRSFESEDGEETEGDYDEEEDSSWASSAAGGQWHGDGHGAPLSGSGSGGSGGQAWPSGVAGRW